MIKEELLAIKVGDQWLDSSGNFLGTCTVRTENELGWTWHRISNRELFLKSKNNKLYDLVSDVNNIHWKMLTPLLKELL